MPVAGTALAVALIGLFGLFPSGRPERRSERLVIWTAVAVAAVAPLLDAVSGANLALTGWPPGQDTAAPVTSGIVVPALTPLSGVFTAVYNSYSFWIVAGVVLLALRYRHGPAAQRRQVRRLLIGVTASFGVSVPVLLVWWEISPDGAAS